MNLAGFAKLCSGRVHYAWIVLGIAFITTLAAVGVRAAPGVMIPPLQRSFGWDVSTISGAVSVNLILLGALGPFIMALMDRFGIKPIMIGCLAILVFATGSSIFMTQPWHLFLTWGLLVGMGASVGSIGMATALTNNWFQSHRGFAIGLMMSANAAGQLIFLPIMASLAQAFGWEGIAVLVTIVIAAVIPMVWFFLPETPAQVGLAPLGGTTQLAPKAKSTTNPIRHAFDGLRLGARSLDFWLLGITFGVCGFSTQGLIGTHMVSYCLDKGIPEVGGAAFLAALGIFNMAGSALSGWLSDRMNPRMMMFWLFTLRGIALFLLPLTNFDIVSLSIFTVFYGLNWIAIVAPQYAIVNEVFGKKYAPVIISWIFVLHQVGGGLAAFGAGWMRDTMGSYTFAFMLSGAACFAASLLVLRIQVRPLAQPA